MLRLILAIFLAYVGVSDACSCYLPPGWQEELYCRSNWGGTFKVISNVYDCSTTEEELNCYSIIDLDQTRGVRTYLSQAVTRKESNLCGTTLTAGRTYFVGGYVDNHRIGVGLCMLLEDWTNFSCKEIDVRTKHFRQLNCGDGLTTPPETNCVRKNKLLDLSYIMCRLRKVLKLNYTKNCRCKCSC